MRLTKCERGIYRALPLQVFLIFALLLQPVWFSCIVHAQPAKKIDFVHSPINSFDQLAALVLAVKRGELAERRLLDKMEKGGIKTQFTEEQLQQLQAAGATPRTIQTIRRLVPPPPPAPAPKRNGTLMVTCEPVDCSISVGNSEVVKTLDGKSKPLQMLEGTYVVKASAPGYETDQDERSVQIPPDGATTVPFHFRPTRQAFEDSAKELYQRVVTNLGGDGVLKDAARFRAAGTLDVSDRDGRKSTWSIGICFKAPDTAKFTLIRANKTHRVTYTALEGYRWEKPPSEAPSLEDVLYRICQFNLANMLGKLRSPSFSLISTALVADHTELKSDNTVRAESSYDSYEIDMNSVPQVKEIKVLTSGFNSGLRVQYDEYTGGASRVYPRLLRILLSDKRGIDMHFANFEYSPPDMTDDVFLLKGGKVHKQADSTR